MTITDASAQCSTDCGADNLLLNCMGVKAGDSVLLVLEPNDSLYDPLLEGIIRRRAQAVGAHVSAVTTNLISQPSDFPNAVALPMRTSDHTLFLSRVGDYVRFVRLPGSGSKTTSYTLNTQILSSPYACVNHKLMQQLRDKLEAELMTASRWRIRCPLGSDISGSFCWPSLIGGRDDELTVTLFPVATFKPVPCNTASGHVALSRWLLPGAAAKLEFSGMTLNDVVSCQVENGYIRGFSGAKKSVARVNRHYDYVSGELQIARNRVHSWHLGINPQTWFANCADEQLDRWCAVSFGSPRYLHFHTCGDEPPGEVAWSVFHPTVTVDDELFWHDGQFSWLQRADNVALISNTTGASCLLKPSCSIGL